MNGFDYIFFFLDRIYRIFRIFVSSHFPEESEMIQSAFGGKIAICYQSID